MVKPITLLTCLLFSCAFAAAQNQPQPRTVDSKSTDRQVSAQQVSDDTIQLMRQDLRSQRKQIVAQNLTLTETEATKFWPIYDKYVAETIKINNTRYGMLKEYSQTWDRMTDDQANSFIKRWIAAEQDVSALRMKWVPEFEKVISPKKTAAFFQIDTRTWEMINVQLASQIPLIKH